MQHFGRNPVSELKYEYLKSELNKYDHLHLTNRLIEEIERNDINKFEIYRLQTRTADLEKQKTYLVQLLDQTQKENHRLEILQQMHGDKLKRLEDQIALKGSQFEKQSHYERKYKQLHNYMQIYTNEINNMQQEFKDKFKKLTDINQTRNDEIEVLKRLQSETNKNLNEKDEKISKFKTQINGLLDTIKVLESQVEQLANQNSNLNSSSKKYLEEYNNASQIIENIFKQLKSTEEQLNTANAKQQTIIWLQTHLNESVAQIERLNELIKEGIRTDKKAYAEFQRLEGKYSEMRAHNEKLQLELNENSKILSKNEVETSRIIELNNNLRQRLKEHEERLSNYEHKILALEALLKSKQNEILQVKQENEKKLEHLYEDMKKLQKQIQQNYSYYKKEIQNNSIKHAQQLDRLKKSNKSTSSIGIIKEKFKEDKKQFRLGQFQSKVHQDKNLIQSPTKSSGLKHIISITQSAQDTPQQEFAITKSSRDLDETTSNLKKIVDSIGLKVNQLSEGQANLSLKTELINEKIRTNR